MAAGNSKSKKAPVRKSTGGQTRKTTNNKSKNKETNKLYQEAFILIMVALSIIFFIANFGVGGVVGAAISSFFFGLFGLMAYIFPILLIFGTFFAISNKNNSVARVKLIAAVFVILFLCTLIQLIAGNHADEWKFSEYYFSSSSNKNGGGFFGGAICKLFCTWFGTVGAYIFDIVLIIIGIVVISEHSFIGGVKHGSKKVVDTARYDMEQYKESSEAKRKHREEVKLLRASRKAKGVSLDTEIPKDEEDSFTELNDIKIKTSKKKEEPAYNFEPAAPVLEEPKKSSFAGDILPFDEEKYIKAENVTDYATRHYEEEQSSPFENFEQPVEEYVDTKEPEPVTKMLQPEPAFTPAYDDNDSLAEDLIDTSLVNEEFEKESQIRHSENITETKAAAKADAKPEEVVVVKAPAKKAPKYVFPPLNLLKRGNGDKNSTDKGELRSTAMKLQQTLANFGVKVTVTDANCGPSVTRYELQPEQGVKVSKIVSLADDIKLNLAASDIRIEAPIPGKAAVGIEVPNKTNSMVMLGDLFSGPEFKKHGSPIAFAAGKDIGGQTVIADIAKMPHLLIAGATGSGKSVCINTIIMSILYKAKPEDVKLIMIDPKVVELSVYNGIPHLLIPVVTDPKKAAGALNWAVAEMTERYNKFALYGVRDLKGYNEKVDTIQDIEDENKPVKLPQIVIIVDELADLMMVSSNEVEDAIVRLSQLARAAGIHLIIATQRPSVNVITGLIKANVPSRIAFSVSSGVDSRTIIDMNGAEKLLGKGDMLFYPQGYQKPARVQGAFVSDEEVSAVVEFIKEHSETAEYNDDVTNHISNPGFEESQTFGGDKDQYFAEAGKFIIEKERASIGMLQRIYKIGFNRAARIMDQLCDAGVVGPEEGTKPRKVLMTMEEFMDYLNNNN